MSVVGERFQEVEAKPLVAVAEMPASHPPTGLAEMDPAKAITQCPFLGKLALESPDQANLLLELMDGNFDHTVVALPEEPGPSPDRQIFAQAAPPAQETSYWASLGQAGIAHEAIAKKIDSERQIIHLSVAPSTGIIQKSGPLNVPHYDAPPRRAPPQPNIPPRPAKTIEGPRPKIKPTKTTIKPKKMPKEVIIQKTVTPIQPKKTRTVKLSPAHQEHTPPVAKKAAPKIIKATAPKKETVQLQPMPTKLAPKSPSPQIEKAVQQASKQPVRLQKPEASRTRNQVKPINIPKSPVKLASKEQPRPQKLPVVIQKAKPVPAPRQDFEAPIPTAADTPPADITELQKDASDKPPQKVLGQLAQLIEVSPRAPEQAAELAQVTAIVEDIKNILADCYKPAVDGSVEPQFTPELITKTVQLLQALNYDQPHKALANLTSQNDAKVLVQALGQVVQAYKQQEFLADSPKMRVNHTDYSGLLKILASLVLGSGFSSVKAS